MKINIKNKDNYCFIWSYIRHINPKERNPNRIKLDDKKLFSEIYEKLKNFKFPLEINKTNIKKIEDILKINIYILASDKNDNIIPISKNRKYFCNRCFNSFLTQKNLDKHKYLSMKYNKRLEKIILPEENSKVKFKKINHMIRSSFTVYFDIETYSQYLKRSNQKITKHDKIQTGIYEVDLTFAENLHYKFKDYTLCPEIKSIPENNLSKYQKYLNNKLNIKYSEADKKLILDLLPKKNYKVYYKNLEYYIKLGIKVHKVNKILTCDEKPFLKKYIDLNTELRKNSKNDLEKDLFKLMNNAIFGKSMENVLNKSNITLINNNPEKLSKLIKEPNFENIHKIFDKQVLVQSKPVKTKFNKPIYLGACILETSKLHMYKFWYDYLKVKYGDKFNLLYTDTDSFLLEIFTDDVYEDMKNNDHLFDFSEYPKDHKCYSER